MEKVIEQAKQFVEKLDFKESDIDSERKALLKDLANEVIDYAEGKDVVHLNFICTHNSRRSQLAELWFRIASLALEQQKAKSYSGGTETTAFNPRMVRACRSFGFPLVCVEEGDNPKYICDLGREDYDEEIFFSKKYNDDYNPTPFFAILVCDHASQNCPVVAGADKRFSLTYIDPKISDDTPEEENTYFEKVKEIGREMVFFVKCFTY